MQGYQFPWGKKIMRSVLGHKSLPSIDPVLWVGMQRAPLTRTESVVKRVSDIALAVTALVLLSPLMLMTALAIRLDGAGPVMVRRRRTGFDGRPFFIYKFRTPSVTEEGTQIVRTRRSGLRDTEAGRMLGQSSVVELPQLFNVLKGDMSLIGPRPHAIALTGQAAVSNFAHRRGLKPGITGWAEVNGLRGEPCTVQDIERRTELDLWYLDNWSFCLDFKIVWRTCFEFSRTCFELKRPRHAAADFVDS
jgi:undecaprenyl-phosphate galactose phosphotransferase/putative colanic acid biosynthesis UDP-glucose lipid carrier transferase